MKKKAKHGARNALKKKESLSLEINTEIFMDEMI